MIQAVILLKECLIHVSLKLTWIVIFDPVMEIQPASRSDGTRGRAVGMF
jgi:hypothetical protein